MNFSALTVHQLYDVIQNTKLDALTRRLANQEFESRRLSIDEVEQIIISHDARFIPEKKPSLHPWFKAGLILFPFIMPFHSIFASKFLSKGEKKKWKEYWFYLSLGYLLWTGVVILFARYLHPIWG